MRFFDRFKRKKDVPPHSKSEDVSIAKKADKRIEKTETTQIKKAEKQITGSAYKIIVRPMISEKATVAESENVYTFVVNPNVGKDDVKKAVRQIYGVTPVKVRIMNVQGKILRFGRKHGRRKDWKKAIVTLPKGQSIGVHEGV